MPIDCIHRCSYRMTIVHLDIILCLVATITDIIIYHIFSGKYSSFGYLIKCHMPTLYHTPTLYTLLFNYMIECIKHGTKFQNFPVS